MGTDPADQDNLSLQHQYGDRYNEIVRPDRVFAVSHYLRTRWAPLLGAARFWFVVALRQRCYWNDRQDWFIADKKTLARESGLSLRTVNRIIAAVDHPPDEETRDSLAAWFFDKTRRRRYRQQVGRTVNAPNRYHVLLDDPLTPADQYALDQYLANNQNDTSPEGTLALLQELCTHTSAQLYEILSFSREPEQDLPVVTALFTFDVVSTRCPMPDRKDPLYAQIARAASELHNKLTRPEHVYVGNQYFRLQWLPTLGPVLSSVVLNLRARCYWDKKSGELRDTCRASWADLAREIGCTTRQLRNLRTHPDLERFVTTLDSGHTFKVQIPDPLTETDRERFARETDQIVDPETGQAGFAEILAPRKAQKSETLAHRTTDQSPRNSEELALAGSGTNSDPEVLASGDRKFWHIEGLKAEVLARTPGNSGTTVKVQIMTPTLKGLVATALDLTPELQRDEQELAAAARALLLNSLGIQPPGLGKLLSRKTRCDIIAAWGIYVLTQPGLTDNRAGFLYRRLADRDSAPPGMIDLAALSVSDWQALKDVATDSLSYPYRIPVEADIPAYEQWSEYIYPVWGTLHVSLGNESEQNVPDTVVPPKALSDLLTDREDLRPASEGWEIITPNLYRAYQLLTMDRTRWQDVSVKVYFTDGYRLYVLPSAWLTLQIAPLTAEQWRNVQMELKMVMPRRVFAERWQRVVKPLGIYEPDRVVLGVSSWQDREWLVAWQRENVERVVCGVLGRRVEVQFWCYEELEDAREDVPV